MDDERGLDQMEWSEDGQLLAVSTTKGIFQTKGVSTLILNWGLKFSNLSSHNVCRY